jgi:hypothetical protein
MKKYSTEYWLAHYEFAMGHKSKINIDTSNIDWTRNNIEKVLQNEIPLLVHKVQFDIYK